jgi:hypothetical protein
MLSEALCSRARRVSERRANLGARNLASATVDSRARGTDVCVGVEGAGIDHGSASARPEEGAGAEAEEHEVPFARRAREAGKVFRGGKRDGVCF